MTSVLTIPTSPVLFSLYQACKSQCHFGHKTHAEFLVFLLNSAVQVVSIVKEFSPIIEDVCPSPKDTRYNNVLKTAELPKEEEEDTGSKLKEEEKDTGSKPPNLSQRINSPVAEVLQHSLSEPLSTPSAIAELIELLGDNSSSSVSVAVQESNLITSVKESESEQLKPDIDELMAQLKPDVDEIMAQLKPDVDELMECYSENIAEDKERKEQEEMKEQEEWKEFSVEEDRLLSNKLLAEHFKNYGADIKVEGSLFRSSTENYPEENIQLDICKEGPWVCSECRSHYCSKASFMRHIKSQHHRTTLLSNMNVDQHMRQPDGGRVGHVDEDPKSGTLHNCKFCGELYPCWTELKMHLRSNECISMINRAIPRTVVRDIQNARLDKLKKFKCPKCNASLVSRRAVGIHINRNQCRKKCQICGFVAYRRKILIDHMQNCHHGDVEHSGVIMRKMSSSQVAIESSQQKVYNCQHCEFSTNSAAGFGSHISNKRHDRL